MVYGAALERRFGRKIIEGSNPSLSAMNLMIKLKDFIKNTLIDEIRTIQLNGHHFLSFGLISQGIEFLGCCLDKRHYFQERLSKERFRKAITNLFPPEYQQFNSDSAKYDLFRDLRCGLLHVCLPKSNLELIQEAEIKDFGNHLEEKNIRGGNKLIIVSQEFLADFEKACLQLIEKIDQGDIDDVDIIATEPN